MSKEVSNSAESSDAQGPGALLGATMPLPANPSPSALAAPVRLVESSPMHLTMQSRWYARFVSPAARAFLLIDACAIVLTALVWVIVNLADPLLGRIGEVGDFLSISPVVMAVVVAIFMASQVWVLCYTPKWIKGRALHFDRDANQLLFGPASGQQTRPLNAITALQLIPTTTSLIVSRSPQEALARKEAMKVSGNRWLVGLLEWALADKIYQLNVVFSDGSRLNLTNWWAGWNRLHSIQALTQQLADFLHVPLSGQKTA